MKNKGDSKENFVTIYRNGKEIKVYVTHTFFHKAKNEELRRMGLPSLEEQIELIADEVERMQRLKVQSKDESLAIKLQEEEERGLHRRRRVVRREPAAVAEVGESRGEHEEMEVGK